MRSKLLAVTVAAATLAGLVTGAARAAAPPDPDPFNIGVHDHRVVQRIALDGGAFTAVPAPKGSKPKLTEKQALRLGIAAGENRDVTVLTGSAGRMRRFTVAYGLVSVRKGLKRETGGDPATYGKAALPVFTKRPAWIVASVFDGTISCPSEPVDAPTYPTVPSYYYDVTVIDADTGTSALEYQEAGNSPCSGTPHPAVVSIPTLTWSVPWTAQGSQLVYTVPACSVGSLTGGGGTATSTTYAVLVQEPFGPLPHCKPARTETQAEFGLTPSSHHAAVGLQDRPDFSEGGFHV